MSSAPSVRHAALGPAWSCPTATPRPCSSTSMRSQLKSPPAPTPSWFSIRPAGTPCPTRGKSTVSITATIAFASSALTWKIPAFHRANPGIDIRVIESDECLDLDRDDIDLAIRYGAGTWSNVSIIHLFDEEMFPICSAKMAKKNPDIANIRNIPKYPLLHLGGAPHQRENWNHLLELAGLKLTGELGGLWFSNYSNIVEAARDGHGVAIGWRHVVERHMESGELVNPTGKVFKTGRGFYLLKKQSAVLAPAAQRLHDWVLREFK